AREAHRGLAAPAPEHLAALDHLRVVASLLPLGAEGVDEAHDGGMHVERHGRARAAAGHDADDADVGRHVEAHAPVGFRHRAGEVALAVEIGPALHGIPALAIVPGRARRDLLTGERVGAVDQILSHPGAGALAGHGRLLRRGALPRGLLAAAGADLVELDEIAMRIVHENLVELAAGPGPGAPDPCAAARPHPVW